MLSYGNKSRVWGNHTLVLFAFLIVVFALFFVVLDSESVDASEGDEHTITYYECGDSDMIPLSGTKLESFITDYTKYFEGTSKNLPTTLVYKEGWKIEGWYDNYSATGSPIATIDSSQDSDLIFYAKWVQVPTYNYVFDSSTSTYSLNGVNTDYIASVNYNKIATLDMVVPATYNDGTNGEWPVTSIANNAFSGSGRYYLKSVDLSQASNLIKIGSSAFQSVNLSISLEGLNLEYIGGNAFSGVIFPATFTIPSSITTMEQGAFSGIVGVENLIIPDDLGVNTLPFKFAQNIITLKSVTVGSNITVIGASAFLGCGSGSDDDLKVVIRGNVTSIENYAFQNVGSSGHTVSIVLPASLTNLKDQVFEQTSPASSEYVLWFNSVPAKTTKTFTGFSGKIVFATKVLYDARTFSYGTTTYAVPITISGEGAEDVSYQFLYGQSLDTYYLDAVPVTVDVERLLTKVGYHIGSLNTSVEGDGISFNISANCPEEPVNYHVMWVANNYSVSFEANGVTISDVISPIDVTYDSVYGDLPRPTSVEGTFIGWFTAAEGGVQVTSDSIVKITEDTALYAYWIRTTLTYDANNGSDDSTRAYIVPNQPLSISANSFSRAGWIFSGWNTAADGRGISYTPGDNGTFSENTTLYAQWTAEITIIYHRNNGYSITTTAVVADGQDYTITDVPVGWKNSEKIFKGWDTRADGTGERYRAKDTVSFNRGEPATFDLYLIYADPVMKVLKTTTQNGNTYTNSTSLYESFEEAWNTENEKNSSESGTGKTIEFILMRDWVAADGILGTGDHFDNGVPVVGNALRVKVDLNGHSIVNPGKAALMIKGSDRSNINQPYPLIYVQNGTMNGHIDIGLSKDQKCRYIIMTGMTFVGEGMVIDTDLAFDLNISSTDCPDGMFGFRTAGSYYWSGNYETFSGDYVTSGELNISRVNFGGKLDARHKVTLNSCNISGDLLVRSGVTAKLTGCSVGGDVTVYSEALFRVEFGEDSSFGGITVKEGGRAVMSSNVVYSSGLSGVISINGDVVLEDCASPAEPDTFTLGVSPSAGYNRYDSNYQPAVIHGSLIAGENTKVTLYKVAMESDSTAMVVNGTVTYDILYTAYSAPITYGAGYGIDVGPTGLIVLDVGTVFTGTSSESMENIHLIAPGHIGLKTVTDTSSLTASVYAEGFSLGDTLVTGAIAASNLQKIALAAAFGLSTFVDSSTPITAVESSVTIRMYDRGTPTVITAPLGSITLSSLYSFAERNGSRVYEICATNAINGTRVLGTDLGFFPDTSISKNGSFYRITDSDGKLIASGQTDLYIHWQSSITYYDGEKSTSSESVLLREGALDLAQYGWYIEGQEFVLPTEVAAEPHRTFSKWLAIRNSPSTETRTIGSGSSGTKSYYAAWEYEKFTLHYDLCGGSGSVSDTDFTIATGNLPLSEGVYKKGNDFGGWYLDEGYTQPITMIAKGTDHDVRVFAKWVPYPVTLNFNAMYRVDGATPSEQVTIEYGVPYTLSSSVFERAGYTLVGWHDSEYFGTVNAAYGPEGVYTFTSDNPNKSIPSTTTATLYAVWEITTYTVTIDAGAHGTATNVPVTYTVNTGSMDTSSFVEVSNGYLVTGYIVKEDSGSWVGGAAFAMRSGNTGDVTIAPVYALKDMAVTKNTYIGTYDGMDHSVSVTVSHELPNPIITYQWYRGSQILEGSTSNTYVLHDATTYGTLRCVVTVSDGALSTETTNDVTATIYQKPVTITSPDAVKVYDGQPIVPGEAVFEYKGGAVAGEGFTIIYDRVVNVTRDKGIENIFSVVSNDGTLSSNYVITKEYGTVKITKRPVTVVIAGNTSTVEYDGTSHSVVGGTISTDDEVFSVQRDLSYYDMNEFAVSGKYNVGTYTLALSVGPSVLNNNFTVTYQFTPLSLTITKKAASIASGSDSREYNGDALTCDTLSTTGFLNFSDSYVNVTGSITSVGSASNTYVLVNDTYFANYDVTESYGTLTVTEAVVAEPVIASKIADGNILVADVPPSSLYSVKTNLGGSAVGEYDVVLTLADPDNYRWSSTDGADVTLVFQILAVEAPVITESAGYAGTYDGNGHEISVTATHSMSGEYALAYQWYKFADDVYEPIGGAIGRTISVADVAQSGFYRCIVTIELPEGTATASATVAVSIDKADSAVTADPEAKTGLIFNGGAQELVTAGSATGGTLVYRIGTEGDFSSGIPAVTAAGRYVVYYKVDGGDNYLGTSELSFPVSIAKLAVQKPEGDTTEFVFNGSNQQYSIAENSWYNVSGNIASNAGTSRVDVMLADKVNVEWDDGSTDDLQFSFVILPMSVSWPVIEHKSYSGAAQTASIPSGPYDVVSNEERTNAGSYPITLSLESWNYIWEGDEAQIREKTVAGAFVIDKAVVQRPAKDDTVFTYNGLAQTFAVASSDLYTVTGNTQTIAGTHRVTIALVDSDNYVWNNGNSNDFDYDFVIAKLAVQRPAADETEFVYNAHNYQYSVAASDYYTVSGDIQKEAGSYTVTVALKDKVNTKWSTGDVSADIEFAFNIAVYAIEKPVAVETAFTYNGESQIYNIHGSGLYTISGNVQTDAGEYTVTVALKSKTSTTWADGSTDDLEYSFVIAKQTVQRPAKDNTVFTYNGQTQTFAVASSDLYTVTGNTQTAAGTYRVTVALKDSDNYVWNTGSSSAFDYDFVIAKQTVQRPAADERTFTYNGQTQTYNVAASDLYTVTGNVQTDAGNHSVIIALKDDRNYRWDDNTYAALSYQFVIGKLAVQRPVADDTEFIYDGHNQVYAVAESDLYTITGNIQKNVGDHTVTVALKDKANTRWSTGAESDDIEFTFSIGIYSINKPVADQTVFTYNGESQAYGITGSGMYTITGKYQTDAGTYTVTVALKDKTNTEWADGTTDDLDFQFVINKLVVERPFQGQREFVYNGESQSFGIASAQWYAVTGDISGTEPRTYTANIDLVDRNNTVWSTGGSSGFSFDYVITKITVEWPVIASVQYTGAEQNAVIPADSRYAVISSTPGTNAGAYSVTLTLADTAHYKWSDCNTAAKTVSDAFVITKAVNVATVDLTLPGWIIGEDANTPSMTARFGGAPVYTYSNAVDGTFTSTVPSEVGTWYVKATVAGTANYEELVVVKSFTILGTTALVQDAPEAVAGLVYSGSALDLVTAGTAVGGTMMFSLSADGQFSATIPAMTDAGTYTVYYYAAGNSGYDDSVVASVQVTIAKADAVFSVAPSAVQNLVYTGQALQLIAAGTSAHGSILYALGDSPYDRYVPEVENAGTYTVMYRINGDANHNDIEGQIEVTVAKADNAVTGLTIAGWTFGATANQPTATATNGSIVYTYCATEDGEYSAVVPATAGTWYVKASAAESRNYKAAEAKTTFVISKAVVAWPEISSVIYNGSVQTATVAAGNYHVTANLGGTGVGKYPVTLTLRDAANYRWADSEEAAKTVAEAFEITKASNGVVTALSITGWQFGSDANAPVFETLFGEAVFTYCAAQNGEFAATVPSSVGTWYVKATVAGTADYNAVEQVASFEITQVAATVTTAPAAVQNLVFTGQALDLVTAGTANGGNLVYRLGEIGDFASTVPTATDAGTYTVFYKVAGDADHDDSAIASVNVVVAKAGSSVTTAPAAVAGLVYNGQSLTLVTAGTATGGNVLYRLGETGEFAATIPSVTSAGTYNVFYKVAGDANHEDIDAVSVSVAVAKAVNSVTGLSINGWTFGAEASRPFATATDGTVVFTYGSVADGEFTATVPASAGTWYVKASVAASTNYEAAEAVLSFVISKAVVEWPSIASSTFTGTSQAAKIAEDSRYTVTANIGGTGTGKYSVTLTLSDSANYKWADTESAAKTVADAFEITKAASSVTRAPVSSDATADGSMLALVLAGTANGGTMVYRFGETGEFSESIPMADAAGTYAVFYKVIGDADHLDTEPAQVIAEILPATPSYRIEYILDGGVNSALNPARYLEDFTGIEFAPATKEGYRFAGWFADKDFATQVTGISAGSKTDVTVFAKFVPCQYNAILDPAGGFVLRPSEGWNLAEGVFVKAFDFGTSSEAILKDFGCISRNGYEFTAYSCDTEVMGTAGMNITAGWKLVTYSVTFDTVGGDAVSAIEYSCQSSDIELPSATKEGSIFVGWQKEGSAGYIETVIPKGSFGDMHYVAVWTVKITVENAEIDQETKSVTAEAEEGKDYVAVYIDEALAEIVDTLDVKFNNGGSISFPIEVLKEAGTVTMKEMDRSAISETALALVGEGTLFALSASETTIFDAPVTVSLPYTHPAGKEYQIVKVYWLKEDGTTEEYEAVYSNGFVTFQTSHFSDWIVKGVDPEFVSVIVDGVARNVAFGSVFKNVVTAPAKAGYTFAGWYADSAHTTAFDANTVLHSDVTVYAKYNQNQQPEPEPEPEPSSGGKGGMCGSTIAAIVLSMCAIVAIPAIRYVRP